MEDASPAFPAGWAATVPRTLREPLPLHHHRHDPPRRVRVVADTCRAFQVERRHPAARALHHDPIEPVRHVVNARDTGRMWVGLDDVPWARAETEAPRRPLRARCRPDARHAQRAEERATEADPPCNGLRPGSPG